MIAGLIITVFSSACEVFALMDIFKGFKMDFAAFFIIYFGIFLNWFTTFFPVVGLASHYIVVQTISLLALSFSKYRMHILHTHDFNEANKICFHLFTLISQAEDTLSPMILLEFITCLVTTVFGLYFATTAIGAFSIDGEFN